MARKPKRRGVKYSRKRRSYARDFGAGVDPFGTISFKYGMKDVISKDKHPRRRRAVNTLGGMTGGILLIPSATYGLVSGTKAFAKSSGGLSSRMSKGALGAAHGAMYPYKAIMDTSTSAGAIRSGRVSHKTAKVLKDLLGSELPAFKSLGMFNKLDVNEINWMLSRLPKTKKVQIINLLKDRRNTALSTLGIGAMVSGGAANVQYRAGRRTRKAFEREKRLGA